MTGAFSTAFDEGYDIGTPLGLLDSIRLRLKNDSVVRSYIPAYADPGAISENRLFDSSPTTAIAYFMASRQTERYLSSSAIRTTSVVNIEIHSIDLTDAYNLAEHIRSDLDGLCTDYVYPADTDSYWAGSVFVQDEDEDYVPKQNMGDEAIHIVTLRLTVIGAE